jgi:hypothetical protein
VWYSTDVEKFELKTKEGLVQEKPLPYVANEKGTGHYICMYQDHHPLKP